MTRDMRCSTPGCDTTVDDVFTCEECVDRLAADLALVPGLVVDMTISGARLARMSSGRIGSRSAETPIPVHLGIRRPLDALVNSLTTWARLIEDRYRTEIPLHSPGLRQLVLNRRAAANCQTSRVDRAALSLTPVTHAEMIAVWLLHNLHIARILPPAGEMIADLERVVLRAQRAVDRAPDLRFIGTCPHMHANGKTCGAGLRAERGETWVRCPQCREQYEIAQIQADQIAQIEDRLCTIGEIAKLLAAYDRNVPRTTLLEWAKPKRGLLRPRAWMHRDGQGRERITGYWIHRNDPPLYRFGDAVALAPEPESDTQRTGA